MDSIAMEKELLFTVTHRNDSILVRRHFLGLTNSVRSNALQFSFGNWSLCLDAASLSTSRVKSFSWIVNPVTSDTEEFNGWLTESISPGKNGVRPVGVIGGICASALLAVAAYFFIRGIGLGTRSSYLKPLLSVKSDDHDVCVNQDYAIEQSVDGEPLESEMTRSGKSLEVERVKVNVLVDPIQREAFTLLKKLQIVEDEYKDDELCTRREYCRWLLQLNSLLERNPKHRILLAVSLCGSVNAAFDDVDAIDPDFKFIQCLAEVGLINSKLSNTNASSDSSTTNQSYNFYPDRFVTRKDIIQWRIPLEYGFTGCQIEQMSTVKATYMDMREIDEETVPDILRDLNSGDMSITRQVFGNGRRLQARKATSRAQAAVALASGRMSDAIRNILLERDAENASRLTAMEDIKLELQERGNLRMLWREKLEEEAIVRSERENVYANKLNDVEYEKIIHEKAWVENMKEKEAMTYQRILCASIRSETEAMSAALASEKAAYASEQYALQETIRRLHVEKEGLKDSKITLQTELEGLQNLRMRMEDEARRRHARARVLEDVAGRWNWDTKSGD